MAISEISIPIQVLLFNCADFNVVPDPQKQSKTILFSLEEVLVIKFAVGAIHELPNDKPIIETFCHTPNQNNISSSDNKHNKLIKHHFLILQLICKKIVI
ncbi:MAG TPA: hypothetical protein PKJ07_06650 [Bacteroidales bacterium]|nr:hypothetical protein [Bacteroidales bacterium]